MSPKSSPSNKLVRLQSSKPSHQTLLGDVRDLIQQARQGVARAVNSGLVTLYWHVGRRIRQDILREIGRASCRERV